MKVREAIRIIEQDGWYHVRTRGSHRQFNHLEKPGLVTIPGKLGDDLGPGLWAQIRRQAQLQGQ
ncbi:MAG: type II toxin-antitoxin system HicA family toxin [Chloroflexi bacterium]|nr:type II toxin-antitoxin system HicA family toxin [Chloroflexota bacterium]